MSDIVERLRDAVHRVSQRAVGGSAPLLSIPPQDSDVDVVCAEAMVELTRLRAREAELVEALKKLRNEAHGVLSIAPELREIVGNTNIEVLKLRMNEAEAILARARAEKGETT